MTEGEDMLDLNNHHFGVYINPEGEEKLAVVLFKDEEKHEMFYEVVSVTCQKEAGNRLKVGKVRVKRGALVSNLSDENPDEKKIFSIIQRQELIKIAEVSKAKQSALVAS